MNILGVPKLSVCLVCFMSMMFIMGYSCRFCILLGGFGGSGVLVGGIIFENGV